MSELDDFIRLGSKMVRASEIDTFETQYYNGGQTKVTYVTMKSGTKFQYDGTDERIREALK